MEHPEVINEYTEFLNSVLYYVGRGTNNRQWTSFGPNILLNRTFKLIKPIRHNTRAKVRIVYYHNAVRHFDIMGTFLSPKQVTSMIHDYGHEFKLELFLPDQNKWDTFFEGWVDSVDELKTIFKCVGIPLNLKENDN